MKMVQYKSRALCLAILLALLTPLALPIGQATALSGSDFRAGRIIDDGVFFSANGMSVQDIQTFLNAKVPTCDTNGTQPYGGTTRAAYATGKGYPPPYTCVKNYRQDTVSKPAEAGLCNGYAQVNQSAAEIIYGVAHSCGINPKALIVLLQKEQGLITDDWPWSSQYQKATGYGCPDTAACDTQYAGFFNQVYSAARQFKRYAANASNYNFLANRNNYIQYNPTASCGGSTVFIQNQATAGLYNYTPYQPNGPALNNLYGAGNDCSAYGNRNFWRYYNDWFGSTYGPNFPLGFERLEGSSYAITTGTGKYGAFSKTITAGNVLHAFYYDSTNGNLRHSWADNTGWHFETLDGSGGPDGRIDGNVGGYVTGYYDESSNTVRVFYYNYSSHSLRYAQYNQTTALWTFETLDGASTSLSKSANDVGRGIAVTPYQGGIQLFYYDATAGNLRHAWNYGSWGFENLDGDSGSIAGKNGDTGLMPAVTTYDGTLQLFYYDATNGNLRHGWHGAGWGFENLDGDSGSIAGKNGDIGHSPSVTTYDGTLQVYYYDATNGVLRHTWNNAGWKTENLDGRNSIFNRQASVGQRSVVKQVGTDLYVFYQNLSNNTWCMSWTDKYGWHTVELDGTAQSVAGDSQPVGGQLSTDIYTNGIQIFYGDGTGALKHSWRNN